MLLQDLSNSANEYGICNLSSAPVRAEPGDRFEQVNTLLFGEYFRILERLEKWIRISTIHDDYQGWLDIQQFIPLLKEDLNMCLNGQFSIAASLSNAKPANSNAKPAISEISLNEDIIDSDFPKTAGSIPLGDQNMIILPGSILPSYKNGRFSLSEIEYIFDGEVVSTELKPFSDLNRIIKLYLNAPYHWGGRSPFGVDCSGLVQVLYRLIGINLPRDASMQAKIGEAISFLEETIPGDLVFFDNAEGRITHVGILLAPNRVLHASGWVRVDCIDHQGIFNPRMERYSHKLRTIRRVL